MTTINFAYTIPFPKDSKITQEQAFNGLRIKARDPTKFVPIIVECQVLEERPDGLKRKITMKNGKVLVGDVTFHKPSLVRIDSTLLSYVGANAVVV